MEFSKVPLGFTFTTGGDAPGFDMGALKAVLEQMERALIDRINREMIRAYRAQERRKVLSVRVCLSGHTHGTLQGRIFCDEMQDYPPPPAPR